MHSLKMTPENIYRVVYELIGDATPLGQYDCGKLCNRRCCHGDEDSGMYLYPFEDRLYRQSGQWYKTEDSDFVYDEYHVKLLTCPGECRREERPLACRIFPLAPYKKQGSELRIIVDSRSFGLCPLAQLPYQDWADPTFYRRVEKALRFLCAFPPMSRFIEEMSYQMDEYRPFLPNGENNHDD